MKHSFMLLIVGVLVHISASVSLGETADLSIHVKAHKSTLVLGEPLFITARVHNQGTEPVKVAVQSSPSYALHSMNPFLVMISADGSRYHAWFDGFRSARKTSPIELAAGAELSGDLVIVFGVYDPFTLEYPTPGVKGQVDVIRNHPGFAFEQPGEYWVLVNVKLSHRDVPSFQAEPIQVTVTRPGRENLAPFRVLSSDKFAKKYGALIQVLSADDLRPFDDMIKRFPDSIYTEYLALNLGRWYLEGRNRDKSKARPYLEIAKSMSSSNFIKAKVMKALSKK